MATRGDRWAFWLEAELDKRGWVRADIPKRSTLKPNGRPVIDGARVSEWLNKGEAPRDPAILRELARIFGIRVAVVLNAAGWLPDEELEGPGSPETVPVSVLEAIDHDLELIDEARAHLKNQYQLLLRVAGPASDRSGRTKPDRLRAVARGGNRERRAEVGELARRAREEYEKQNGNEDRHGNE